MAVNWINTSELSDPTNTEAESAVAAASWILYKLTGEKYPGIETTTEWYGTDFDNYAFEISPELVNGQMVNLVGSRTVASRKLYLRHKPIVAVQTVQVGGQILTPDSYSIANRTFLLRNKNQTWNFNEGVLVSYTHGAEPPEAGKRAARRLADELVYSLVDPDNCALPERITSSVSRQGLSYTILDPQDFIDNGRTGLYEVDLFIKTANPSKARKKPKVFSPDIPSGYRLR